MINVYCFRKDTLPLTPNEKLTCRSCVTSLAFHPSQPSILGAGTVSGMNSTKFIIVKKDKYDLCIFLNW